MSEQDAHKRNRRRSAVMGIVLGSVVGLIYFAGLSGVLWYLDYQDDRQDEFEASLLAAAHENTQARALINEIVQDNKDLSALSGGRVRPRPYPPTNDPSVNPNPNN